MSIHSLRPLDFSGRKTISLHGRGGKVTPAMFAKPHTPGAPLSSFLNNLPKILAADTLREVAIKRKEAKQRNKSIIERKFAATITRLDRDIGRIFEKLEQLAPSSAPRQICSQRANPRAFEF